MKQTYTLLAFLLCLFGYAQPLNDECANATLLTVSSSTICTTSVSGTLQGATASGGSLACAGTASYDVWYQFVATNERHGITISDIEGLGTSLMFEMYEGFCNTSSIHCGSSTYTNFPTNLTIGQTYFIRVYPPISPVNQMITFNICVTVPGQAIITSDTNYTINQLVNDVLINTEGIIISNITSSTGTNFGSDNGIGYFNSNETDFVYNDGIILSTGSIATAPGPNTGPSTGGSPTWPGDNDLDNILNNEPTNSSVNATSLEFDFVSSNDILVIDYIFASEEYGTFQCTSNDSFAIILTDLSTGLQQNIAVVPGTTIPVSVATVRNMAYNSNCLSSNAQHFGTYYLPTSTTSPVNFNGLTVPLTAEAAIIPGNNYHIKFVIADEFDYVFDSALFIKGFHVYEGVVDIGEPDDLTTCDNDNDGIATFDLTYNNSILLEGLNAADYTVTYHETLEMAENNDFAIPNTESYTNVMGLSTGGVQIIYARVTSNLNPGSYAVTSFAIIVNPAPLAGVTEPIVVLDNDMDLYTTVDLTTKEDEIVNGLSPSGFTIGYYTTEEDAAAAVNAIADAIAYDTTTGTIYFRLENNDTGCFTTGSFEVIVLPSDYETPPPSGEAVQTFTEGETLANLELEGENIQWYALQSSDAGRSDDMPLPLTTPLADNTTYYASQTVYGIESSERFPVTANAIMGITDNAFAGLKIYPNPVQDVLAITGSEELTEISVYNVVGQMVYHINLNATTLNIDFSSLSKGIYVIKMLSGEKEAAMKVVKQ